MAGWHHRLNGHEFEQALGGGEGQESLACCSPWDHKELDMIEPLNNSNNMSTELVMPFNPLILCWPLLLCPQSFSASRSFTMCQLFVSGSQSIGVSDSASVLPINIQDWFPLGWTGWISLTLKILLQHHSSKASIIRLTQKYQRKRRVALFKI